MADELHDNSAVDDALTIDNGRLGMVYIPKSLPEIRDLYALENTAMYRECLKLAREGSTDAAAVIGMLHNVDAFRDKTLAKKATPWGAISAQGGNPYGVYCLGVESYNANDMVGALQHFTHASNEGFYPAAFAAGLMYQYGFGVPPNVYKARELLQFATERKHALGRAALMTLYRRGHFGYRLVLLGFLYYMVSKPLDYLQFFRNRLNESSLIPEKMLRRVARINEWDVQA